MCVTKEVLSSASKGAIIRRSPTFACVLLLSLRSYYTLLVKLNFQFNPRCQTSYMCCRRLGNFWKLIREGMCRNLCPLWEDQLALWCSVLTPQPSTAFQNPYISTGIHCRIIGDRKTRRENPRTHYTDHLWSACKEHWSLPCNMSPVLHFALVS